MNYYCIPKNRFNIDLNLQLTDSKLIPFISHSLFFHLNDINNQLCKLNYNNNSLEELTIDYINKIVNPFEFINTSIPGSLLSVSKVRADASIFFELLELFQLFNINDILSYNYDINVVHLTPNHSSTNNILNILREDMHDIVVSEDFDYDRLYNMFITNNFGVKIDLLICEFKQDDYTNNNKYIQNMLLVFIIISKYQSENGSCIIKIDTIFYKAIVDIIFLLSSFYEKIILVKPNISNITRGERYLICNSFNYSLSDKSKLLRQIDDKILPNIHNYSTISDTSIYSLLNNEIPYYILNKLDESNVIIGQQQLEAYDQIINIFKNKNREEKIEIIKRQHIQKCIHWCEKNKLPHNTFIDKTNMFLTPKMPEIPNTFFEENVSI